MRLERAESANGGCQIEKASFRFSTRMLFERSRELSRILPPLPVHGELTYISSNLVKRVCTAR
jgi:hypothetical protein